MPNSVHGKSKVSECGLSSDLSSAVQHHLFPLLGHSLLLTTEEGGKIARNREAMEMERVGLQGWGSGLVVMRSLAFQEGYSLGRQRQTVLYEFEPALRTLSYIFLYRQHIHPP